MLAEISKPGMSSVCYAIDVVKASMSFPCNRKVLIGFIMRHRNMDIIINKSKKVQYFAEHLIKSTVGGINSFPDIRIFGGTRLYFH
jgi:hypothetical protein